MKVQLDANGNYADAVEIYQLTAPNGKSYIGQAQLYRRSGCKGWLNKGMDGRWKEHVYEAQRGVSKSECRLLYNSIRKYGSDSFKQEVLLRVSKPQADYYETKFIQTMGTKVPHGLNLLDGGGVGCKHSEETRQKISEKGRGRKASDATRLLLSKDRRNRAATSGLPALVSRCAESAKHCSSAGYRATVRHESKKYAKAFVSKYLSMQEKLRLAVEARDKILKDLGLPAITDDPAM